MLSEPEVIFVGDTMYVPYAEWKNQATRRAALDWSPISETNLPKVGDEVGRYSSNRKLWLVGEVLHDWNRLGHASWTHRRPLNAPPVPDLREE